MITLTEDWQFVLFALWMAGFFWFIICSGYHLYLALDDRADIKWFYIYALCAPIWFLVLIFFEAQILFLKIKFFWYRKRANEELLAYHEYERKMAKQRRHKNHN